MNTKALYIGLVVAAGLLTSCDDEVNIGQSIAKGEVTIEVDSLFTVSGHSVRNDKFDSRAADMLIGRLHAEGYGELEASFASRLLPSSPLAIPDTLPTDSVKSMVLRFTIPSKSFTGDSLAPQQLSVYRLNRQLPDDIDNATDLNGYYDASSPLGTRSYTLSALGTSNVGKANRTVTIPLSVDYAREIVAQYRKDPAVFQWPESFAKVFPGIIVKSTFGRGMVANVASTQFITYYNVPAKTNVIVDGVGMVRDTLRTDSATLFAISPEVLSANLLSYRPADNIVSRVAGGECVIASPAGYNVELDFPTQAIIDRYKSDTFNMAVINSLSYTVPARSIANSYGLTPPPYLLMIRTDKIDEFFRTNSIPQEDDAEVFWASYDSDKGNYVFDGMRPYLVQMMQKESLSPEDVHFTLVPVEIKTETAGNTYNPKTVVTGCQYYLAHPSMALLDIAGSKVKFTYSRQVIK